MLRPLRPEAALTHVPVLLDVPALMADSLAPLRPRKGLRSVARKAALATSAVLHATVFVWAAIGMPHPQPFADVPAETVEVSILSAAAFMAMSLPDTPPVVDSQQPDALPQIAMMETAPSDLLLPQETAVAPPPDVPPMPETAPVVDALPLALATEAPAPLPKPRTTPKPSPAKPAAKPAPKASAKPAAAKPAKATEKPAAAKPAAAKPAKVATGAAPAGTKVLSKGQTDQLMAGWANKVRNRIERGKRYPDAARQAKATGRVGLKLKIDRGGNLIAVGVTKSSGHASLDQAALMAVKKAGRFAAAPKGLSGNSFGFTIALDFQR